MLDLRQYRLQPGESRDLTVPVDCESVVLGGLEYTADQPQVDAHLRLQPTSDGLYMRLRFACELTGPCQRCLEEAKVHVGVDATEYHQHEQDGERWRTRNWLATTCTTTSSTSPAGRATPWCWRCPPKILCREDCAGLCPRCGATAERRARSRLRSRRCPTRAGRSCASSTCSAVCFAAEWLSPRKKRPRPAATSAARILRSRFRPGRTARTAITSCARTTPAPTAGSTVVARSTLCARSRPNHGRDVEQG